MIIALVTGATITGACVGGLIGASVGNTGADDLGMGMALYGIVGALVGGFAGAVIGATLATSISP